MRIPLACILCVLLACAVVSDAGAAATLVKVGAIEVAPEKPSVGQHPKIAAWIQRTRTKTSREPLAVTVIAVVTLPNNVVKSQIWKNVALSRGQSQQFTVSPQYDITLAGKYKVQFVVYSADMRRHYAARSTSFSVIAPSRAVERGIPAGRKTLRREVRERNVLGIGIYGNALNPAGGATLMLWPFRSVGLQGSYTAGTFTSYEARLLVKFERTSGFNPYIGAGYMSVSTEEDVLGITTKFQDDGVSGVIGVEMRLSRTLYAYLEVSGATIDLQEIVTSGPQTVKATVEYSPVTIGAGLIFYLF